MIKAGIFDLDGTLAYTLDSMAYVANEVMKKHGTSPSSYWIISAITAERVRICWCAGR